MPPSRAGPRKSPSPPGSSSGPIEVYVCTPRGGEGGVKRGGKGSGGGREERHGIAPTCARHGLSLDGYRWGNSPPPLPLPPPPATIISLPCTRGRERGWGNLSLGRAHTHARTHARIARVRRLYACVCICVYKLRELVGEEQQQQQQQTAAAIAAAAAAAAAASPWDGETM